MAENDNLNKDTDRDVRPTRGQESNENWDDKNTDQQSDNPSAGDRSNARSIDEQTNTSGAGSTQRSRADNVGPLDSDLAQLPSQKRMERGGNLSGPGLG